MNYDVQKIILVLIIIVLLAGLAWELKYIEDLLISINLSPEEKCENVCKEKEYVAYYTDSSCYCKEPITLIPHIKCFWNVSFEEYEIFSKKFNASSMRNLAVKAVVKYPSPNSYATKIFAIYNEVSNRISYISDPRKDEYVASPLETWEIGGGDCDDFSILLASMYEAVGLDASLVKVYNPDKAHVFVIIEVEQDLGSFLKTYKAILERYTPYYSEKGFNLVVFGRDVKECEDLEKISENEGKIKKFYVIVDSIKKDYPGSSDAFEGYQKFDFIKIGE